ncbi:catalase family protein [Bordetella sp. N]|uniref:catalase family protein n=1 Tax=Bordetella sp. N TaxID=1746199 RepID=UPI00070B9B3B|nr:catalase family protein [Bordetella sp. N]ALM82806.1 catalase [Bordetella sp. N]
MPQYPTITPIPFDPQFERIPEDENETARGLVEALRGIIEKTYEDYGHAVRSVHAKSHGLLTGELAVYDDIPDVLAHGIFKRGARYPVVLRISTNPGDILADSVSTPRGMALKVIGVEGERLPGAEGAATQDFVMVNSPAFMASTPKEFLRSLKLLAKTTDKAEGGKKALSAVLRGTEKAIEALGGESGKIKSLGGHPATNPLGETYYTVVPLLYGLYFGKISVAPVSAALTALKDAPVDVSDDPNALRAAVNAFFAEQGGEWEVRVQLATDLDSMPIEDAAVPWPEDQSPYIAVGRINVAAQPAWSDEKAAAIDDGMAFNPWHGITEHRPLGGIMRTRKPAYEMSAQFRGTHNGCPMHEPSRAE